MSEDSPKREPLQPHYEGGIAIFPGPDDEAKAEKESKDSEERSYKERQLALDRRMVFFTGALFICTLITAAISGVQAYVGNKSATAAKLAAQAARDTLWEMQHGSGAQDTHALATQAATQASQTTRLATDTHGLVIAAERQAEASKVIATNAQIQARQTTALAASAGQQAEASKVIATNSQIQAIQSAALAESAGQQVRAIQDTALAAKSAAETARDTLHISERAYLSIQNASLIVSQHVLELPLINTGHIPSGKAHVITHFASYAISDPFKSFDVDKPEERHTWINDFPSIFPGKNYSISLAIPTLDVGKLNSGHQYFVIALTIFYTDGFPDSPPVTTGYCVETFAFPTDNRFIFQPCDVISKLPLFERNDSDGSPKRNN